MEEPNFSKDNFMGGVNRQFNDAIKTLKSAFGIDNLSAIELFHLRKIQKIL